MQQAEWTHSSPQRLIHYPTRKSLRRLAARLRSPLGLFMLVWLVSNVGPNAVFALYPLVMQHVFGIAPGPASLALAVVTGLALGGWAADAAGYNAAPVLGVASVALSLALVVPLRAAGPGAPSPPAPAKA